MRFGRRGVKRSEEYYKNVRNLTSITLEESLDTPSGLDVSALDTLTIINAEMTAEKLNALLKELPRLKTLIIKHATIDPEEFKKINLNFLPELQWLELSGNFVPDHAALEGLLNKHPNKNNIRLLVDSAKLKASLEQEALVNPTQSEQKTESKSESPAKSRPKIEVKATERIIPIRYQLGEKKSLLRGELLQAKKNDLATNQ